MEKLKENNNKLKEMIKIFKKEKDELKKSSIKKKIQIKWVIVKILKN